MQFQKGNRKFNKRFSRKPKSEYDSKLLGLDRVTRVTAAGKQLRFRAVVAIGNKKGKIGLGVAKGMDVQKSIEKATRLAKKSVMEVPMFGNTIPHEVEVKYGSARVLLRPQAKGRGLVAGGQVRVICSLAGIKDISSKLLSRSRNKLNIARATVKALKQLKIKEDKSSEPSKIKKINEAVSAQKDKVNKQNADTRITTKNKK